jgi:large subunit ribosomal protein L23
MVTEIIFIPIVTEKLTILGEKLNRYGFIVDKRANKLEIKQAVESLYGVTVAAVNTMRYAGKIKSRQTKSGMIKGRSEAFKKAVITLAEGEKIDFYSNI